MGVVRDTVGGKIAFVLSREPPWLCVNFPFPPLLKFDFPESRNHVWKLLTSWDFEDHLVLAQQTLRSSLSFSK